MSLNWVKITLDSPYFVAGERVSGEINCNIAEPCKLIIKSLGEETILIENPDGAKSPHSSKIYHLEQDIYSCEQCEQSIFPFTFKIPQYSPASYSYTDIHANGVSVEANISYFIEAIMLNNEGSLAGDRQSFTVLNKLSRVVVPAVNEITENLTACCCISRGSSKITIKSAENSHIKCYETNKYLISVNSEINTYLESIIAQLVIDVSFNLPGSKEVKNRKILARVVPEIRNIENRNEKNQSFEFEFEAEIKERFGGKPSSNLTGVLNCEYKLQVFAIYNVGCRSKRAEFELFVQVNPGWEKEGEYSFPEDWQPREHYLKSLLAESVQL